jgi:hypothetical protein
MILGLPDPDPLVRGTDPDPYQAKIERKKTLIPLFCDLFLRLFVFEIKAQYIKKVRSKET